MCGDSERLLAKLAILIAYIGAGVLLTWNRLRFG